MLLLLLIVLYCYISGNESKDALQLILTTAAPKPEETCVHKVACYELDKLGLTRPRSVF